MSIQSSEGQLAFLLFVPLAWVLWLWMIISKPAVVFHTSQVFFNFLAMACFASVAAFQGKWGVGPSGLTGFGLFITIMGILLSSFMMAIPVAYEKYDKMIRLARALKEVRVGFILTGTGTGASLLIAFIVTISAWTQPGCKNADNDPHADKGDDFKKGLIGWCNTKKAAAIFLWLAFAFWGASLGLLIMNWRQGKLLGPRDPPFEHPTDMNDAHEDDDEEASYHHIPPVRSTSNTDVPANPFTDSNRYSAASSAPIANYTTSNYSPAVPVAAGRPSMDAYGAFSDPAPSGFGVHSPARANSGGAPMIPGPDLGPQLSRTMQYADPYAAVRANLTSAQQQQAHSSPYGAPSVPPSYESYTGYR
ncbi:hypothetical protein E1B28_011295 [Marasmius oreades]|uniref:MARVEL domain-containing protein n=1 Tax=Marasmius oreades TaxID=181124 RepID=A0A9P7RUE9_9AGAR|nr:uncharacterized protein E1B28_011295 [Marasmius oreades]KAG7089632.1 hypothetical protein E1B28_011295 [Marasmius oreades]